MITSAAVRPVSTILALVLSVQAGFSQPPQGSEVARQAGPALKISVIEGANAVNSITLLRSVAPVVEVADMSDFPVEGAVVVFTLPEQGPGGTFLNGLKSFTTKSDARGQAVAPFTINGTSGKFQIIISATLGDRHGETVVTQTNNAGGYVGPPLPGRSWYKRWPTWVIAGGVVAGVITFAATRNSGSSSSTAVTIVAGAPVFH
jgi:hypothetical protein